MGAKAVTNWARYYDSALHRQRCGLCATAALYAPQYWHVAPPSLLLHGHGSVRGL